MAKTHQTDDDVAATPVLPGSEHFDVDTASADALEEHVRILKARMEIKALTSTVATPAATQEDPSAFWAANQAGERRKFSPITWAALNENGKHAGWEVAVETPTDVQTF